MKQFLVVGYGNTLRGDDGLGPYIAERLEQVRMPPGAQVHIECLPQLDVCLVLKMRDMDVVVFVDARQDADAEPVRIATIERSQEAFHAGHTSHTIGLSALLGIVHDWYGKTPRCLAVMPKGYDFAIGAPISKKGLLAAQMAVSRIVARIEAFA